MSLLNGIISEKIIGALGWTLFHSLWQGAVIASLFVLLMVLTRKSRPQVRYIIGVAALLLMFTVSTLTLLITIDSPTLPKKQVTQKTQFSLTSATTSGEIDRVKVNNKQNLKNNLLGSFISFFKGYFKEHLPLIVTVWLLGMLLYVLKFTGGFMYKKRFKTSGVREPSEFWQKKLQVLCNRMGVTKPIRFMESSLVKVPVLVGHFKPVILFPASIISGLPQGQVEVLLVHELAHILRKDYLINILQHLLDILYFYHPGIRWISSMIRYERENCCDDMAISMTGNTLNFAKALTNIYSNSQRIHGTIMAITGSKNKLLNRIKRILSRSKSGSKFSDGFIAASILSLCILTITATANWSMNSEENRIPVQKKESIDSEKTVSKIYILKENTQVEIRGKIGKKDPSIQKIKLFDYNTGELVWSFKNQLLKKEKQGYSLKEKFYLEKGCYELKVPGSISLVLNLPHKKDTTKPILINVDDLEVIRDPLLPTSKLKLAELIKGEQMALQKAVDIRQKLEEKQLKRGIPFKEELVRKREEEHRLQREILERQKEQHEIQKRLQEQLTQLQNTQEEERLRRDQLETLAREVEHKRQLEEEEKWREAELLKRKLDEMTKEKELRLREALERQKLEISSQRELGLQLEELRKYQEELTQRLAEEKRRLASLEKRLHKELAVLTSIKKELLKDKLIKKEREFEFKISAEEMLINGKKQPHKLFKKYKKLYESKSGGYLENDSYVTIIDKVD
jgi:beta-lactamase regulating signal transducer with metallopeptidase domain